MLAPGHCAPGRQVRESRAEQNKTQGDSVTRLIGDAGLQVYRKMNMYFGVRGNFGQ